MYKKKGRFGLNRINYRLKVFVQINFNNWVSIVFRVNVSYVYNNDMRWTIIMKEKTKYECTRYSQGTTKWL